MLMCMQNLVRFCQAILKIMNGNKNVGRTEGRNNRITEGQTTTEGQGESSIAPTFSKRGYKKKRRVTCLTDHLILSVSFFINEISKITV